MRIAYVSADQGVPVFGCKGCSIHVQEVLRALVNRGAEIDLFTPRIGGETPLGLESVRLHRLPTISDGDTAAREKRALEANEELGKALMESGPLDWIYERYSLWSHAGMDFAAKMGIPGLLEVNAPLIEEQIQYRKLVDRSGAKTVSRQVFQAASTLIAVSDEVAGYLRHFHVEPDRIHVISNGVDADRFAHADMMRSRKTTDQLTIGFVGSLKPWHGLTTLLEAFAKLQKQYPTIHLLIVGEGPERLPLERLSREKQIEERVTFLGAVASNEVPSLLAKMDIGVAPYPRLEHFYFSPLKVFEYMAAGLPVIASATGQLVQIIQHEHNGILYEPGDEQELARSLQQVIDNEDLRVRLGRAGRLKVLKDHTWDGIARRIVQLAYACQLMDSQANKVLA